MLISGAKEISEDLDNARQITIIASDFFGGMLPCKNIIQEKFWDSQYLTLRNDNFLQQLHVYKIPYLVPLI